jgi:YesN/AraC family two-component response regulator
MNNSKILIVEDEEDINELLKDFLEMKGCNDVTTVTRGREALEYLKNGKFDIVFLDIVLEDDVDGMEVLKEGRAVSADTKFVMMSAYKEEYGRKAKELGACAFLGKPVEVSTIKDVLKKIAG